MILYKSYMKKINLFIILLFFYLNCTNPFNTRDVEQPDRLTNQPIIDNSLFIYDSVLTYFRHAINNKNIDKYIACFIDTILAPDTKYKFIPDYSLHLPDFEDWGLEDEKNYMNKVLYSTEHQIQNIELTYMDEITYEPLTTDWNDSLQTNFFQYQLLVQKTNMNEVYTGKARMKLIKNINSQWAIYFWEDTAIAGNDSSWSLLKARNR